MVGHETCRQLVGGIIGSRVTFIQPGIDKKKRGGRNKRGQDINISELKKGKKRNPDIFSDVQRGREK
jgi:hypothetical protein